MLSEIEKDIFRSLGLQINQDYFIEDVFIDQEEYIHTIYIPSKNKSNSKENYYFTHGFGGSSLFFFDLVLELRQYGEIVLFDLRGMGFSSKNKYVENNTEDIIKFYLEPIQMIRLHFNHKKITIVGHSFGGYLAILLSSYTPDIIERVIAFSPIGITPADQDLNSKVKSCSDCISLLINKLGWKFRLTYKTLLRYFGCCCRTKLIKNSFQEYGNSETRVLNFTKIIMQLYEQKSGSQILFFKLFQPRVLPKYCLRQHFADYKPKIKISLIYGQFDWIDKKGAQDLKNLFPENFQLVILKDRSHQLFFEGKEGQQTQLIDIITKR